MPSQGDRRAIAQSAAAMYAGAAVVVFAEAAIPGGEHFSVLPGCIALVALPLVLRFGRRMPPNALALLGLLSAAGVAYAVATTHEYGDGAILYVWPVLWMSYFYGLRGSVLIVAWIGAIHAWALLSMPAERASMDRWIDVMVSVVVAGVVVRGLAERNARLVRRLEAEARTDPLTRLLNRRGFAEEMGRELARAHRERYTVAAIAFDVDHFKAINDDFGHEVGDNVLACVGAVLSGAMRAGDVGGRLGGDEMIVLLPRADAASARAFAERIADAVEDRRAECRRTGSGIPDELSLTLSTGLAASAPPFDGQALLHAADEALYAAKRAGRDRIVEWSAPIAAPRVDAAYT